MRLATMILVALLSACSTGGLLLATPKDGGTACDMLDDDADAGCDAEAASGDGL